MRRTVKSLTTKKGNKGVQKTFTTVSAEETILLGRRLATEFPKTPLFLIAGDFGVGKTTLIKGLASGLLLSEEKNTCDDEVRTLADDVKSPSFTLVNEYSHGDKKVYHADFYRLNSEEDLDFMDFDEILMNQNNRVIIEWFDNISLLNSLQKSFSHIILEVCVLSDSERIITLTNS